MAQRTIVGMGYRHSEMNRCLQTTGASNILTRLASRSITGHTLPIQVHQHYGLEFHLVLAGDSCIRRACWCAADVCRITTKLERRMEGLRSCVFEEGRVLPLSDKVEECCRALPAPDSFRPLCDCDICNAIAPLARWIAKDKQAILHLQSDNCCKSDHMELIY